jgi:hypothetical protein
MSRWTASILLVAAISLSAYAAGGGVKAGLALVGAKSASASAFSTAASFGGAVYYLHNNPTPPVGGTVQQATLPLTPAAPTATTLYNYDTDRDAWPGRLIAKGGSGAGETDLTKYQSWRSSNMASPLQMNGTVSLRLWSAMKNFDNTKAGSVLAYLSAVNPGNGAATLIATASLTRADWMGTATGWVEDTLQLAVANVTIPVGRQLEVKLVVANSAGDDMWFAYDTIAYPASLTLP